MVNAQVVFNNPHVYVLFTPTMCMLHARVHCCLFDTHTSNVQVADFGLARTLTSNTSKVVTKTYGKF